MHKLTRSHSSSWGQDSTDGNGFRLRLANLLETGGNNVTYVGDVNHGTMSNNACEAYPGRNIDEVARIANDSSAWKATPNVVLVHLGTNDCRMAPYRARLNGSTAHKAAIDFTELLTEIGKRDPSTLVIASTLIRNLVPSVNTCLDAFNELLPPVVAQAKDGGQKVVLVDMHDAVPTSDINATDYTHPTDAGYEIMAGVWYQGILNASSLISAQVKSGAKGSSGAVKGSGFRLAGAGAWMIMLPIALVGGFIALL